MKKIICLAVSLSIMLLSVNTSVYASSIDITGETGNDHITLTDVKTENNMLTIGGYHCDGAGYDITMSITDSDNTVYALAETVSKNKGIFSFNVGLEENARYKDLTAKIRAEGDDRFYAVNLLYTDDIEFFDIAAVQSIINKGNVAVSNVEESNGKIVVNGNYAKGAGYDLNYRIIDSAAGTSYAKGSVTSMSGGRFSVSVSLPSDLYDKTCVFYILGEGEIEEASVSFTYIGGINKYRDTISEYISQITDLINECENKDISVEYEKSNMAIIQRFNDILNGFYTNKLSKEYEHNYYKIIGLAEETIDDLRAYLNGTKAEKIAPVYSSSAVKMNGQSLIAQMNVKGEIKEQPMFFNGLGHWNSAIRDFDKFNAMGINAAQYEVGPSSILKSIKSDGTYEIDSAAIQNVKNVFKTAEDNNLSVVFMTAMHYFPSFIYETYPEIINNGNAGDFLTMMPYNPTHPKVKEALEAFLRAIIPEIKDYKSLQSICLANEPLMSVRDYPEYYLPSYHEFLKNKYGTIQNLNAAYGTDYSSFDEATMPKANKISKRYNDYREFNDSILIEWFTFIRDVIEDIAPGIPLHIKCTSYITSDTTGSRRIYCATNAEKWASISDMNGCDAWGIYGEETNQIQGKMMWYDFMTSLKNAPVVNSEDHILREAEEITYNDDELKIGLADMWQGAIHGRASSVYWLWDTSERTQSGTWYYNTNLAKRVDYIAGIAKTNHDLNRLANEITALQKKDARTAILYSNYSQAGVNKHCAAMFEAYKCLISNGEKVFVANDTYPEKINENENLQLLIVPGCKYMPESVWNEIKEFEERGKTVIFAELSDDYYDENGDAINTALKNAVLNGAVRVSFNGNESNIADSNDVWICINNAIAGYEKDIGVITDNDEIEWSFAEYNGGYVVNLCNYSNAASSVEIEINKEKLGYSIKDLTENEEMADNTFNLAPYETKLIRIDVNNSSIKFYNNGDEAANVVSGVLKAEAKVYAEANQNYAHIIALYNGNELVKCEFNEGCADENGYIHSDVIIDVPNFEDTSKITVKSFIFDSLNSIKPLCEASELSNS